MSSNTTPTIPLQTGHHPLDHFQIGPAALLPTAIPTLYQTLAPLTIPSASRPVPLELKISWPHPLPAPPSKLPLLLISHGHGPSEFISSLRGYEPVSSFFASRGFVVIQPTHLSSRSLGRLSTPQGASLFWRERAADMSLILDNLSIIESSVPALQGRLDIERVAVLGHSMGGHTASVLLGMSVQDPDTGATESFKDERIKAGVLLAAPGNGGASLSSWAQENASFMSAPDFSTLTTPTLVMSGELDESAHLTTRGKVWHEDPYHHAPGARDLFELRGAKHCWGISGWDAEHEEGEEGSRPVMVATVQRVAWAWVWSALYGEQEPWVEVKKVLDGEEGKALGRLESKV